MTGQQLAVEKRSSVNCSNKSENGISIEAGTVDAGGADNKRGALIDHCCSITIGQNDLANNPANLAWLIRGHPQRYPIDA